MEAAESRFMSALNRPMYAPPPLPSSPAPALLGRTAASGFHGRQGLGQRNDDDSFLYTLARVSCAPPAMRDVKFRLLLQAHGMNKLELRHTRLSAGLAHAVRAAAAGFESGLVRVLRFRAPQKIAADFGYKESAA